MRNQNHIRDLLEKDFPDLTGMPNTFGLFIALISDLDYVHTNEELLKGCDGDFLFAEDECADDKFHCACGQWCTGKSLFKITNIRTNISIVIGCVCVGKHELLTKEEIARKKRKRSEEFQQRQEKKKREQEELERQRIAQQRQKEFERRNRELQQKQAVKRAHASVMAQMMEPILEKKREAEREEQRRLAEERAVEEARRLEALKLTHRQCEDCKEYNIEKKSPPKIIKCKPCWQLDESKKPKKTCACGEEIEYSGKLTCISCWQIEQSKKPKELCVDCGVAPRNNGPRCKSCYWKKRNNKILTFFPEDL
jgi:hypothetical protein